MEIAIEKLPVHEQWSLANQILANIADENFQDENLTISPEERQLAQKRLLTIFAKVMEQSSVSEQEIKPNKRHAGTARGTVVFADDFGETLEEARSTDDTEQSKPLMGSALVELFTDVSMTDEEIALFDEVRKDDDSEPVSFD